MKTIRRRAFAARLQQLLRSFPAVMVCGSRQCGKTTLVRSMLSTWRHLDLERRADADLVLADVDGFLAANPYRIAFDEAQAVPPLFPALRHALDADRSHGRYVVLGSVNPSLARAVGESLAGRIGMLELSPFLACELPASKRPSRWFRGGYPRVHALRTERERADWFDSYLTAFAERDLPALGFRLAPSRIRTLLTMLSHVHGNLLNQSDLARSLGVSVPTVQSHLDVLEGAFLVRRLPPHHANVQKRLTKSPKVFVRDSGLLHFLAGLRSTRDLENWPGRGRSFEGMVIEELIQQLSLRGNRPYFAFWRTQAGGEVDLLFDLGAGLIPVEIKLGPVDRYAVEGLRHCMQDLSIERGYVISNTAQESWQLGEDVTILPWAAIVAGKLPREWLRSRRM